MHPATLKRIFTGAGAALFTTACAFAGSTLEAKKEVVPVTTVEEDIPVHPITAPYWNEDASITTDVRPVFVYHSFPGEILGGGRATVTALQLRVKLLKNLQFVAYKDGWVNFETKGLDDNGWNDLAAGLKWAFYQNDAQQLHMALGLGYEFPSGDDQVLQDDDEGRAWLSIDKGFGKLHLGAVFNYRKAFGNGDDILGNSDSISWHLHADYQLCQYFSPVLEVNGYHVVRENADHTGIRTPFSGADVANLGGDESSDTITVGVGVEVRPVAQLALRAAYEFPITDNLDLYGHRWTFSAVIKF